MTQSSLYDRVKMTVSGTPGTGDITLGSAVATFRSFTDASVSDGALVSYLLLDGNNWEIGQGTYTASGTKLARTSITASSSSGAAIAATASAIVALTALATDFGGGSTATPRVSISQSTGGGSTGYATKGGPVQPIEDIVVSALWGSIAEVAAATYIMGIYELDSSNKITAVTAQSSTVTAATSQSVNRRFPLASPVTLTAGVKYAILHTRTDSTGTTSSGADGGSNDPPGVPCVEWNQFLRETSAAPAVGDTLGSGSVPYAYGIEWAYP